MKKTRKYQKSASYHTPSIRTLITGSATIFLCCFSVYRYFLSSAIIKSVFNKYIKSTDLQCYNWTLYISNFDCQKWLLNRQERLEIKILLKKSECFTLTAFIFITQSEIDVFSCTYTFYDLCLTICSKRNS